MMLKPSTCPHIGRAPVTYMMMLSALSLSLLSGPAAHAAPIDAQAVNVAPLPVLSAQVPVEKQADPDPGLVKLQIMLDRAGISPGVIDGHDGENLRKAVAIFSQREGLNDKEATDPQHMNALNDQVPAMQAYVITQDDVQDLVENIPDDYAEQARMQRLGYTSAAEKLSERFHMDIELLRRLNPTATFVPGETIAVARPGDARTAEVFRIQAERTRGQLSAYAKDGSLIAAYPATIGSKQTPSPKGTHKVKGVARNPTYAYNPAINFQQGGNRKKLTLPSGPNGPVGSVWIDLTEPTYGIHGTPEPSLIDKVGSHGCIRLTNWDAEELAGMVKPGVVVEFVD